MADYKWNIGPFQADSAGSDYSWNIGPFQSGTGIPGFVEASGTATVTFSGTASAEVLTFIEATGTATITFSGTAYGIPSIRQDAMAGTRRLVACVNDELWYEGVGVAAGTMTQLVASVGDIDTSDNLVLVPAFEKAIVLNGPNKKVFDRSRIKITTANVGTHPPDFGTVLTGGTSGAVMVVDYISSLSGACTIYGKSDTTATFANGETVTGLDDDGNAISFVLNANETAGPHWYNLTPFGNSTTFGSLPTKLYLGALYLGRLYMAGNPRSPYQWYASRQGNIFDYLYDQEDVQSACTGSDVEFGAIPDIIRALVQCRNDYLLFGCQSSIYALAGDPRQGGSMKTIIKGVGIFGGRSWCFDDRNILYFWGTGGIYRMSPSFELELMTEFRLPKIVHDEDVDPTTHRITMEYDHKRHGIVIGVTNLLSRANSCYWYERRADAFFPEEYPDECSPFSMLYYDAENPDNRDLLIGCSDGFIRRQDETSKNDNVGATTEAIDSYMTFGPFALGENLGEDGIVSNVYGIVAGGASGGGDDSDNVTYYVYVGDSPEEAMKKAEADTYSITGTLHAPGYRRGKRQRKEVRGKYGAVRLRNNTAGQTWGFEEIEVEIKPAGRLA